jgi:LysR family transcriptional regulator, transcriptional activator of nhaA
MYQTNFKHLHYFWAVAKAGSVARAAQQLHLTPQTLSGQIKLLEENLDAALFRPAGRRLELTETGRLAFSYADDMFNLAAELRDALHTLPASRTLNFRVGVVDVVPKSIAHHLIEPALRLTEPVRLICREGKLENLLADLALHRLDMVLADRPLPAGLNVRGHSRRLGESGMGFFATAALRKAFSEPFPRCLNGRPMLLPGDDVAVRGRLQAWFEKQRVAPLVVGEFDDAALMKAFGGAGAGIFAAPLAIRAEIERSYGVTLLGKAESVKVSYYAISVKRQASHPAITAIVESANVLLESAAA